MIIREEFPLTAVKDVLVENITAVIIGTLSDEERCKTIKNTFSVTTAKIISINYSHEEGKYIISNENDPHPTTARPLKNDFAGSLSRMLDGCTKNILIDLTSLQHSVILALCNVLCKHIKPAHLFASYVKPNLYISRDGFGKYNFSTKVFEPEGVYGLIHQQRDNEIVIPFLGFEGDRLRNIVDSMSYETIVPVIGFPSENPSWQFECMRNCMQILENVCPEAEIHKCKSNSVYDAISTIEKINVLYPDKQFVLLPLGSRPHTAACGLWASKHKNSRILYDYVIETSQRSEGVGDIIIYHLSRFL